MPNYNRHRNRNRSSPQSQADFNFEACDSTFTLEEIREKLLTLFQGGLTELMMNTENKNYEFCVQYLRNDWCKFDQTSKCIYAHCMEDLRPRLYRKCFFKVNPCYSYRNMRCDFRRKCQYIHDEVLYELDSTLRVHWSLNEKTWRISRPMQNDNLLVYTVTSPVNPQRDPMFMDFVPYLRAIPTLCEPKNPSILKPREGREGGTQNCRAERSEKRERSSRGHGNSNVNERALQQKIQQIRVKRDAEHGQSQTPTVSGSESPTLSCTPCAPAIAVPMHVPPRMVAAPPGMVAAPGMIAARGMLGTPPMVTVPGMVAAPGMVGIMAAPGMVAVDGGTSTSSQSPPLQVGQISPPIYCIPPPFSMEGYMMHPGMQYDMDGNSVSPPISPFLPCQYSPDLHSFQPGPEFTQFMTISPDLNTLPGPSSPDFPMFQMPNMDGSMSSELHSNMQMPQLGAMPSWDPSVFFNMPSISMTPTNFTMPSIPMTPTSAAQPVENAEAPIANIQKELADISFDSGKVANSLKPDPMNFKSPVITGISCNGNGLTPARMYAPSKTVQHNGLKNDENVQYPTEIQV